MRRLLVSFLLLVLISVMLLGCDEPRRHHHDQPRFSEPPMPVTEDDLEEKIRDFITTMTTGMGLWTFIWLLLL